MLSEIIKNKIEVNANQMEKNNFFFVRNRKGGLNKKNVQDYLQNVHYLLLQTEPNLKLAMSVSEQRGESDLASFFAEKILEEEGHDQWARNDLKMNGVENLEIRIDQVNCHMKEMVEYTKEMIKKDPRHMICYMTFSEYFTVYVGPRMLDDLENKCGIKKESMTAIGNHIELDKEHIQDDFEIIDQFVDGFLPREECLESLDKFNDYIDKFFTEIAEGTKYEQPSRSVERPAEFTPAP